MRSRVLSHKEKKGHVVVNLSCRHSVTLRLNWWQLRYGVSGVGREIHCPQCQGYRE